MASRRSWFAQSCAIVVISSLISLASSLSAGCASSDDSDASGSKGGAAGTSGTAASSGTAGSSGSGGTDGGVQDASPETTQEIDPSLISANCFVGGDAPELTLGSLFDGADWNDPHVLRIGSSYWMYASSNMGLSTETPVQIYRLLSSDAQQWTLDPLDAVFTVGASNGWDIGGTETPAVVSFAGKYHLFYTGYADPHGTESPLHFKIGHAVSSDGVTWVRDSSPVLGPSDPSPSFYQYVVGEPGPVVVGNELQLYFTAVGVDAEVANTLQVIGVIRSSDGLTWTTPEIALRPDQTLFPRGDHWVGYSTPNAIVIGDQVHLFVDVANDHGTDTWRQEALYHAWSTIGETVWHGDPAPLRRNTDFSWTAREIRSPHALVDQTTLRLYFAGDDYLATQAWGIGQMTCNLAK